VEIYHKRNVRGGGELWQLVGGWERKNEDRNCGERLGTWRVNTTRTWKECKRNFHWLIYLYMYVYLWRTAHLILWWGIPAGRLISELRSNDASTVALGTYVKFFSPTYPTFNISLIFTRHMTFSFSLRNSNFGLNCLRIWVRSKVRWAYLFKFTDRIHSPFMQNKSWFAVQVRQSASPVHDIDANNSIDPQRHNSQTSQ
jgi:hypothetical protein